MCYSQPGPQSTVTGSPRRRTRESCACMTSEFPILRGPRGGLLERVLVLPGPRRLLVRLGVQHHQRRVSGRWQNGRRRHSLRSCLRGGRPGRETGDGVQVGSAVAAVVEGEVDGGAGEDEESANGCSGWTDFLQSDRVHREGCVHFHSGGRLTSSATYRVSQNYPNMQFFAIFATALKPLLLWFPKFSELLIKSQS